MFTRIYAYRIKTNLRDPSALFWMLAFPYILAIIFAVVILPVGTSPIEAIKVAVIEQEASTEMQAARLFFDNISSPDSSAQLLEVQYLGEAEAYQELHNFSLSGVFRVQGNGHLELIINRSDIEQTILRSVADSFNQISLAVNEAIRSNPGQAEAILASLDWVDTAKIFKDNAYRQDGNPMVTYIFALIGMFVMYAMNFTLVEVTYLQANLSKQGARVMASPASKLTLILSSVCAAFTIQMLNTIAFLFFLDKVIGVPILHFGLPLWVLMVVANLAAIALGAALATLVRGGLDLKISLAITISMVCSFLAGMMTEGIRFTIINAFPRLSRLNPVELIADSFYSMYFFADEARVWENSLILAGIAIVLAVLSIIKLRRSDYASI